MGDMIKFTDEHSSQPGYDYCAGWIGLVLELTSKRVEVLWHLPGGEHLHAAYDEAYGALEVISE